MSHYTKQVVHETSTVNEHVLYIKFTCICTVHIVQYLIRAMLY